MIVDEISSQIATSIYTKDSSNVIDEDPQHIYSTTSSNGNHVSVSILVSLRIYYMSFSSADKKYILLIEIQLLLIKFLKMLFVISVLITYFDGVTDLYR